ncbi:glycosyltransferase family 2 protein [Hydromonas duriensis]|uniref:Glycosyltransferase involved in cell wall biosynthesis n=1 Tax=Hydromonas duriensis TaxID=1527608 RepID=A0A4R6Y2I7_9BURK|nr:glycosyltransferase family 2 protein [Hydromonas duriensis]TDR30750.1 glycosyltransferase involved in cell wall biosynthesis [Hydromonas duriensis]
MFKPTVIIPVFNHPQRIDDVLSEVLSNNVYCILVNDGSDHECSNKLKKLARHYGPSKVTLLSHDCNEGKGAAVMTGMSYAFKAKFSHALQIDADGQHHLSDLAKFLDIASRNPDSLICGFPQFDHTVPKGRLIARYLTHVWVWINTLSFRIKDSMCGFRIYPLQQITPLFQQSNFNKRMSWDTEIVVKADWAGIRIINVPTKVCYPQNGVSHFLAFKDNALISWMHTRLFFGMLLRFPKLLYRSFTEKPLYEK